MLARTLLVVVMLGALIFVLWRHQRHDPPAVSETSSAAEPIGSQPNHDPGAANAVAGPNRAIRKVTPEQRAVIADAIAKARTARAARPEPRPMSDEQLDSFSTGFIDSLHQVGPYLSGCYDAETRKHMTAVFAHINLTSAPDVGTLIDPDTITDGEDQPLEPNVAECLRTTLESIELPPLADGDRMSVKFSFPVHRDSE